MMTNKKDHYIMVYPHQRILYIHSGFIMNELEVDIDFLEKGNTDQYFFSSTCYEKIELKEYKGKIKIKLKHQFSTLEKLIYII